MKIRLLSLVFAFCMAMGSGKASLVEPELPKQIHYIWVGGPIFEEYWNDLTTMASLTHDEGYQINLWVENPQNAKFVKERVKPNKEWYDLSVNKHNRLMNETYSLYVDKLKWVNICDVNSLRENRPDFLSPEEHKDYWRYMDAELVGLKNLGAYSDMLRYLIIAQEGGIYFDTDSKPLIHNSLPLNQTATILGDIFPQGEEFLCIGSGNSMLIGRPNNSVCVNAVRKALFNYRKYDVEPHEKAMNQRIPGLDAKRSIPAVDYGEEEKDKDRGALTIYMTGPSLLSNCYQPHQMIKESGELMPVNFWKAKRELALGGDAPTYQLRKGLPVFDGSMPSREIFIAEMMGRKYDSYDPKPRNNITMICRYIFGQPEMSRLNEQQLALIRDLFSFVKDDVAKAQFVKLGARMLIQFKCDTSWGSKSRPRPFDDGTVNLPAGEYLYKYSKEGK